METSIVFDTILATSSAMTPSSNSTLYPPPYADIERTRFSDRVQEETVSVAGTGVPFDRGVGRGAGTGCPLSPGSHPGSPYTRMASPSTTKIMIAIQINRGRFPDGADNSVEG